MTSLGVTSASDPPTRSTSVEFDGTAGSRPTSRYSAKKPTIEMKNAMPSNVNRSANPRRAMADNLVLNSFRVYPPDGGAAQNIENAVATMRRTRRRAMAGLVRRSDQADRLGHGGCTSTVA